MLAILSTHPIQYQVPLWQALAKAGTVPFEVWYLSKHGTDVSYDREFGKSFAWDLDLLAGYPHRFLSVNENSNVSSFNKLRLTQSLQPLLREHNVSALWVQGWHVRAYWQAVRQAHNAGVQVWMRGESNDLAPASKWKQPAKQLMLRQLFGRVDKFLYIGSANRRLYESYAVATDNLHPAPYCVDNDRFVEQGDALRSQRAEIRRAWNIPENALCVLFAAKFVEKKRPFDLINAIKHLRTDRSVHLLFVGSGELGESMRNACNVVFDADGMAGGGNGPAATFAGFLNQRDISKAYVAADCLVLPSDHRETWGLVVNEAMASGLPCIVSDACGCADDLVAPIRSKARFAMGDTNALAAALIDAIETPIDSTTVRNQVKKFDQQITINTVRQLFRSTHHQPVESSMPAALVS